MFIKHVSLKPNLRIERGSDSQRTAAECTLINQNFELDAVQIEMNPKEFAAGKRILQWFESDNAS